MRGIVTMMVVVALATTGCSKSKTPEQKKGSQAAAPTSANNLWALAPDGAVNGMVLGPGAAARVADAIRVVRSDYAVLPGAAEALARMDTLLGKGLPMSPVDPANWDRLGLSLDQPAAAFQGKDGAVLLVLPVADRDAFVKAMGGKSDGSGAARVDHLGGSLSCKAITGGRYACASSAALIDTVGKGAALIAAEARRPAALRGDVELLQITPGVVGAMRFERGGFTARAHIDVDTAMVAPFIGVVGPLSSGLKAVKPAGFVRVRVNLASLAASAPDQPTPIGISPHAVIDAFSGEIVAYTAAGSPPHGVIQLGLTKPDVIAPALTRLCPMLPGLMPGATAALDSGHCRGTLAPPAGDLGTTTLRFLGGVPFDLSVDGKALVLALGPTNATVVDPATTAVGGELRDGDWDLSWWGVGILPPSLMMEIARSMPPDPTITDIMWLYMHLRALGMGVRVQPHGVDVLLSASSQWANPDDVRRALEPLYAQAVAGKEVTGELADLAAKHPDSPLGQSVHNGVAGLVPITGAIGIVAAVAIPAFLKYQMRARAAATATPPY